MKPVVENAMKILRGEVAPIPFVNWSMAPFTTTAVGDNQRDYYHNPQRKMEIQMKCVDLFPEAWSVPGVWPDFGSVMETTMFGCDVMYFDDDAPRARPVISDYDEIDSLKFRPQDSLLPVMLEQYEYMWKHLPRRYIDDYGFLDGVGYAVGPIETACMVMGMSNFLMGLYEEPEKIHQMMDLITEGLIYSLLQQQKINGKLKKLFMPDHASNQIGRELWDEFCFPYFKRICDEFSGCEFVLYHNEGRQIHVGDAIHRFGANITHFGDPVEKLAPTLDSSVVMMGNLHPIKHMLMGKPEDVYQEAMRIMQAAPSGRLWLSTAGGMAPNTPIENVRAAIRAAQDFRV